MWDIFSKFNLQFVVNGCLMVIDLKCGLIWQWTMIWFWDELKIIKYWIIFPCFNIFPILFLNVDSSVIHILTTPLYGLVKPPLFFIHSNDVSQGSPFITFRWSDWEFGKFSRVTKIQSTYIIGTYYNMPIGQNYFISK